MRHSRLQSISALVLLVLAASAGAQEAVRIESTGVLDTRIPIAVPSFAAGPGALPYSRALADVIANDLDFTGLFAVVPQSEFPRDFTGFTPDAAAIKFESWRSTPAAYLVYALVSLQGDTLVVECRLFDVLVSQQVVGKRLRSNKKWARLLAHQFADEIVRFLTGVAGVGSSEICFSAGQPGKKEIYIADYDGGTVTQVTHHGSISIKPKFSPDGSKIAYLSYKDRYPFLYVYDRNTGISTSLSRRTGLNHAPAWAPDGRTLALCLSKDGNTEIYLKNADGSGEQRLTHNRASDTSPTFSPDGTRLAFVSDRNGRPQVFTMQSDGRNVMRLSYQGGSAYDPAWSPNGQYIGYVVDKPGEYLEIYVIDADGSNARRLTDSQGGNESPSWSPDSRHMVFTSMRGGSPRLYTITLETGVVRPVPRLTRLGGQGPSWGPRRK